MILATTDQAEQFLASPLLAGVAENHRRAVFEKLAEARFPRGTPLLSQGKPNSQLYFVVEGSVDVERRQLDGHVDRMATISAPTILGTTTFFRSSVPSATIRASTDLMLWTLDRAGHESLRSDDPQAAETLATEILRVLSDRFDLLDDRITELMAEHADDRPRANEWANFRARLFEDPAP